MAREDACELYIDPDGGLWLTETAAEGGALARCLGNYTDAAARARVPLGMEDQLAEEIARIRRADAWYERVLNGVDERGSLDRDYLAGLGDPQSWR